MARESRRIANQIVAGLSMVSAFFAILYWSGACDQIIIGATRSAAGNQPPDIEAMRAKVIEDQNKSRARAGKPPIKQKSKKKNEPEPAPTYRAPGAFYPDEHLPEEEGFSIDPLMIAVVGGAMIFGLAGAGTFVMMGGLAGGKKEDEEEAEADSDDPEGLYR